MDGFKRLALSILFAIVLLVVSLSVILPVLTLMIGEDLAVILSPMFVLIVLVLYDIMKK